jgi:hypothetical protein
MAFSGNFMCTSFKQEILQGVHNFTASTGDSFKLALYTSSATLRRLNYRIFCDQRGQWLGLFCGRRGFD